MRKLKQAEAATHLEEYEYEDPSGEKVTIPAKCAVSQVEGENTLENGLVIIDANGNEWVWIEVPKSEMPEGLTFNNNADYTTLETALQTYADYYRESGYTDTCYDGCGLEEEEYTNLKHKMLRSVYVNGGFFIGRYETGIKEDTNRNYGSDYTTEHPINETPIIQQNKYVYNWVRCSQAQKLSEQLSTEGNTSSLMFGIQWDLVLKHLEKSEVSVTELTGDSTSWGNYANAEFPVESKYRYAIYKDSILQEWNNVPSNYTKPSFDSVGNGVILSTGATERNSKMNIYDLAGNVYEWTLENSTGIYGPCVTRGGDSGTFGSIGTSKYRGGDSTSGSNACVSFRSALY